MNPNCDEPEEIDFDSPDERLYKDKTDANYIFELLSNETVTQLEKVANVKNKVANNNNRIRVFSFAMKLLKWSMITIILLCVCDCAMRYFNIKNTMFEKLFEFLKYVITILLGYLFANKNEKA